MNSAEVVAAWQQVYDKVKTYEKLDASQVDAFFPRLTPVAMSKDFLVLTIDNAWMKSYIERNYVNYIKQALFELFQTQFTVSIELDITEETPKITPAVITTQESVGLKNNGVQNIPQTSAQNTTLNDIQNTASKSHEALVENIEDSQINSSIRSQEQNQQTENLIVQSNDPLSTFTFENFVIGDSNKMAYSMAVSVAEEPGKPYLNPLFIYGKSGLGKTHLLRAIQNYIHKTLPHMNVVYADSAEFLNDYVEATLSSDKEKRSYKNFKKIYEDADVLLIDDIQYLQGKTQTLEIVFQLFKNLTDHGKQIVFSADRAPKNIDIDERYVSRFSQGGTVDIRPPEIETKLGIIKGYIEEYKEEESTLDFYLSDEIQSYIAELSSSNVRELKGAVSRVIYQAIYSGETPTIESTKELLENHFSGGPAKKLSVSDIQREVANFYKVSVNDLTGPKRSRSISYARQVAIYLCKTMLNITVVAIADKFGKRDHTTIMYSITTIETKLNESRDLEEEIDALKKILRDL